MIHRYITKKSGIRLSVKRSFENGGNVVLEIYCSRQKTWASLPARSKKGLNLKQILMKVWIYFKMLCINVN